MGPLLLFGVGLLRGLRAIERFELHAGIERAHHRRIRLQVAVVALRVEDLGNEAAIGQRRRIAVAVAAGALGLRELGFELGEPIRDPVPVPGLDLLFVLPERLQVLERSQIVEGMDLARDEQRKRSHSGAPGWILGKKRGGGPRLLPILDDGQGLVEQRATVVERRQQRLMVELRVARVAMLAFRQMDQLGLVAEPLQIERDPDAERGRAAKVRVQLHKAGSTFTFSSPTLSMPACISSPGLTGPTPAGVAGMMILAGSSVEVSRKEASLSGNHPNHSAS